MFTGLISDVGEVIEIEEIGELRRLKVACHYAADSIPIVSAGAPPVAGVWV